MTAARVLVADDHAPTRADVRAVLDADPGFAVCAEAPDAPGAVEAALRTRPDVCLLDVNMPGSGVAAAWEIASRLPLTRVVMFTVSDTDADLFAALRAGACGFLLKDMPTSALPAALRQAVDGGAAMPPELLARVLRDFRDRRPPRRRVWVEHAGSDLTSREWQVLDLLRHGRTTSQIAAELSLTRVTVRSHVSSLVRKLGVRDREEAVRLFSETGAA
ncbi:MAG TPA: response regulator transcription factor [Solirubrobacteraceae bacterium]|nr:response regulator transcription factor [Solirubrobacteraceae bacterium]